MFELAKWFWWLFEPANFLLSALVVAVVLLWTGAARVGRLVVSLVAAALLVIGVAPVGSLLVVPLENRFPAPVLPETVAGIVVLGGSVRPVITEARDQVTLKDNAERLTEFMRLARRYPDARLVFTGGSASLIRPDLKEAADTRRFFAEMGMDLARIAFESESRNTYENAIYTHALVKPAAGETWILLTSATHMPRAIGVFRKIGWPVVPFPVDYWTTGEGGLGLTYNLLPGLGALEHGGREWVGLIAYRLFGWTDRLFPGP
ncbi:MAG: YdcF family protein [Alphaproteobacteria bacterium]|nr:YdcF family protein [Alphaproteobacteria bacterium]